MAVKRYRSPWTKVKRTLRYGYYRLLRLQSTPEQMARGLGVGVFAGSFPFFGFQTLIGVSLAVPLHGHPLMAALGTWISNPLTYVPIYVFNFKVGCWLLGTDETGLSITTLQSLKAWREWGLDWIMALMVGCTVMGVILGFLSYWVSRDWLRRKKQKWQRQRHRQQQSQAAAGSYPPSKVG